ncbi:MAG: hypothetical protein GY749_29440 [Desulfobacteraceae bacterium]|nr:hypothetical protein [Desulfobacteraceae bacterium]
MSLNQKQKNEKTDTTFWDKRRGKLHSRKGGWVIGEAVYSHGYSMMDDLVGRKSYIHTLLLNITGRMPEQRLADWFEAVFSCMSFPEPRLWCNQMGSLAGTMRTSPIAASTAGILASDSSLYGPGSLPACTDFIISAMAEKRSGKSAEEIVDEYPRLTPYIPPAISGYSRPIATGDERVTAMERVTKQLGFETGEHLALAYEIEEVLVRKYNEGMNLGGYCAPFYCDQGISRDEQYRIASVVVNAGVLACYVEAFDDNPPESFFPIRCDDMDYQGKPPRPVPDADT